jgi:hypothetical protein
MLIADSIASSAIFCSSSAVRFWLGCGTYSTAGSNPNAFDCDATASVKPVVVRIARGKQTASRKFVAGGDGSGAARYACAALRPQSADSLPQVGFILEAIEF